MAASHVPGDVPFFLSHAGRSLLPGDLLPTRGLSGSILQIQGRLEGGGGDGGSTGAESRSCYLEMYAGKKKDKVDPREEALARWTRCRLTNEPLAEPCVADDLGNMYNKEAVLNALLTKTVPKALYHLSLKSILSLKLTKNPDYKPGEADAAAFCCPITGAAMNGKFRFLIHRATGHVVSDKAIKAAPQAVAETIGAPLEGAEWIPVCPTGEELEGLKLKVAQKFAAAKAKKEAKKGPAAASADAVEAGAGGSKRSADAAVADGSGDDAPPTKRARAAEDNLPAAPANASKKVWKSLFLTEEDKREKKNDFLNRSNGARGQRIGM